MAFTTLSNGLTLKVPTAGTRNWASTLLTETWVKLSAHDHSGSGNGTPVNAVGAHIALTQYATTLTPSGTTQTVNWNNGNYQNLDLSSATGDVTLTLSNPKTGGIYRLWVTQGATFRDLIFPASVKWPQGQAPILSSGAGKVDLIELYYNGSVYYGEWELDFS